MYIYLRRPAYTTRVLHATLGTEGDICICIYIYIYIRIYSYRYICAARHTQIGCYMPRSAMRVIYLYVYIYVYISAPPGIHISGVTCHALQ